MSWLRSRATASGLRAVPEVASFFQSPLRNASSRQAVTFRSRFRVIATQNSQRRHLSDSSPALDTDTSRKSAATHGNRNVGQDQKQSKNDKGSKVARPPRARKHLTAARLAELGAVKLVGASQDKSSVRLHFEDVQQSLDLPKLWFRDACVCESCMNPSSGQKTFATTDVPLHPEIDSCSVESNGDLRIVWANDFHNGQQQKHESLYPKQFVEKVILHRRQTKFSKYSPRTPWARTDLEMSLHPITYSEWMAGGAAFASAFHDLWHYGIIFLREVPQREDAVEDIARQVGHLQSTFYGMTWDVVSKPKAENVAYTNVFLGLHHDLMYWNDVPKIQILHCLENSCEGGDSIFSDGLRAALEIKDGQKDHFDVLSKVKIPYHYDIAPHKYRQYREVFKVEGGSKIVTDIYWSPPFQAPLFTLKNHIAWGKNNNLARWHAAARSFKGKIEAPENVYQYKMSPGDCVLFDNRRVFHGRREFDTSSGKRWLKGGYISQEVFNSKARSLAEAGLLSSADKAD